MDPLQTQAPPPPPRQTPPAPRKRTPEELARLFATPGETLAVPDVPPTGGTGPGPTGGPPPPSARVLAAANTPEGAPSSGRLLPPPRPASGPPPAPPDLREMGGGPPLERFLPGQATPEQVKSVTAVAPMVGSLVGGTLGARQGPIGAQGGATVGASAAELIAMGIEAGVGAPPSPEEFQRRFASAGYEGLVGELGGQALGRVAKGFSGRRTNPATGHNTPAGDAVDFAHRFLKDTITPAQAIDSPWLSTIENVMEGSLFGGGKYKQFLKTQHDLLTQHANQLVNQFGKRTTAEEAGKVVQSAAQARVAAEEAKRAAAVGGVEARATAMGQHAADVRAGLRNEYGPARGPEAVGQLAQDLTEAAHKTAKESASALYDEVDTIAEKTGTRVNLQSLADFIVEDQQKRGKLALALTGGKPVALGRAVEGATTPVAEGAEKALIAGAAPGTPQHNVLLEALREAGIEGDGDDLMNVGFRQAHEIRAALGRIIRQAERSTEPNARQTFGIATQLKHRLDQAMTTAADADNPTLRPAYDTATKAWKQMAETFYEGVLADAVKAEPRLVIPTIIKAGRVEAIETAKKEIGPEGWKQIQAQHLDDLLKDPKGEWVTGDELLKRLKKLTPETIQAVYGKGGADLGTLATALSQQGSLTKEAAALAKQGVAQDSLLSAKPFQVIAQIIKPRSVEGITRARQLLSRENWAKVQSAHAESLLFNGTGPDATLKTGDELMKALTKLSPETLEAAYPGLAQGFWQFARTLQHLQRDKGGVGRIAIQLAQGGAAIGIVTGVATGNLPPETAGVLLSPLAVSRIMLNPRVRTWLIQGMKDTTVSNPTTRRALANLLAWGVREGLLTVMTRARGAAPQIREEPGRGQGAGPRGASQPGTAPPPPPPGVDRSGGSVRQQPGTGPGSIISQVTGQSVGGPPKPPR